MIRDAISEQPSFDPLTISVTLGQRKEVEEWINEVITVYVKEEEKIYELHVKLFIVGLCLTDLNTGTKLRANKFVEKIRDEVKDNDMEVFEKFKYLSSIILQKGKGLT